MSKGFSGIKDVDLKIMSELDDKSLFRVCDLNKELFRICNSSPTFWRNRFMQNFGKLPLKYKPENRSWKNHYMTTFINLSIFKNNPIKFLDNIIWRSNIKRSSFLQNGKEIPLEEAPEWVLDNLWLLDLGRMKINFGDYPGSKRIINHITPYELYDKIKFYNRTDKENPILKLVGDIYYLV